MVEGLLYRCLYKVRRCMPFICGWYSEVERKENGFQGDWWIMIAFTISFPIKYWRIGHLFQKKEEDKTVLIVSALCTPDFWSVGKCLVFFLSQEQVSAVCSSLMMEPPLVLAELWSLNLTILKQVWPELITILKFVSPCNQQTFIKGGRIAGSYAGNWG